MIGSVCAYAQPGPMKGAEYTNLPCCFPRKESKPGRPQHPETEKSMKQGSRGGLVWRAGWYEGQIEGSHVQKGVGPDPSDTGCGQCGKCWVGGWEPQGIVFHILATTVGGVKQKPSTH